MIGKITIGKSFKGCLLYCLNDKIPMNQEQVMKGRAEVLLFNKCYGNQKELIRQFSEVRLLNPKLSKPVLHITLSLSPGEFLPKDKLMEMCHECSDQLGFKNNQFLAVHHLDTKHQHIHIVVNRIGFDKSTVSDSNNFQKIAAYCRVMELKYQLQVILNPRPFLPKELRQIPRQDTRKRKLKSNLQDTLKQVNSYSQFEQILKEKGYRILKGRGITFIDEKKVSIKGSEVGFSLSKIEKILFVKQQVASKLNEVSQHNTHQKTGQDKPDSDAFHNSELGVLMSNKEQVPDLLKELKELIDGVAKPENIPDPGIADWLKRKRKRRHKKPRL